MAAFDFPSSPSVNQTYTANGVTWKWNGTMWMRITGAGYLEKIEEGNSKIEVDDGGSGNITATTDGTERLRITSGGSVAIGVNSPSDKLHVGGNNAFIRVDRPNGNPGLTLIYNSTNSTRADIDVTTGGDLRFTTNGSTERLRITSDGKIGVNNTSPLSDLQVITAGQTEDGTFRIGGSAASLGLVLDYDQSGATVSKITANPTYTNTSSLLKICVDGDANPNQLVLKGDGKIGFNAANPPRDYCFHSGQADTNIQITNNTTGIDDSAGSLIQQDGNDFYIWNKENSFMSLGTNAAERVRITSAGYVGINNNTPPVRLAIQDTTNCKLLLSSSWSGTQEIIFGGGSASSTGAGNNTAAKIIAQASAPGGAATGYLSFYTNTGDNIYERLRLTPEGNIWTVNSSIMHGSGDVTNFASAGRTSYNNVSIRAGNPSGGTSPANSSTAIKIYPRGVRSSTTGNLTGGIAWQHLDPDNGTWDSSYGAGSQIWMGAALHDTPGQERDRFNLWMNNSTVGNTNPNQLAIEAYPNGMVRHPKVPAFMVRNSNNANAFSANSIATWNVTIFNNGSGFANGKFTAPIDGLYFFSCMMLSNASTRLFHDFRVNGTQVTGTRSETHAVANSYTTATISMVYNLSASDYVEVYVANNNAYGGNYANFNGYLIG